MPPAEFSEPDLHRLVAEAAVEYAAFVVSEDRRVVAWGAGAERLLGYTADEVVGRTEDAVAGGPETEVETAAGTAGGERWFVRRDGTRFWASVTTTPIRADDGRVRGFARVVRDRTDRRVREEGLAEQARLAAFVRDMGVALAQGDALRGMLGRCAGAMVKHLGAAFARVWTLNDPEGVLELQASAGLYTHLDGPHGRVPVGQYKIGRIAQEKRPHLTNAVVGDPHISDQEWARREGMAAFAGYPLVVDGRLVGVMALFARHALSAATLAAMASVADEVAIGIERKRTQAELDRQREWFRVTLESIGDAVVATDTAGRVTFLNPVAAELTGWPPAAARGRPLADVFRIVNEHTRRPVESPVEKVLRDGQVVGLANHTILIARDGAERPIDDSAAPIRDGSGSVAGVVLVFHDVTDRRRQEEALRKSEARKAAVLATALDAVVTCDHEGKVVEFNPAAVRMFGYAPDHWPGRDLGELIVPPGLREAHRRGMARHLATGASTVLGRRLDVTAVRADGTEFPVELAITRIPTDGPPQFTAHLRDVTDRVRAERYRATRLAVTQALAQAGSVREAVAGVLRAVCEGQGWDVGLYWARSGGDDVLRCLETWHRPDRPPTGFETHSRERTFARAEGLPGHVWATGQPAWLPDVTTAANFPRSAAAAAEGLHGAFAVPVALGGETLGVAEFFSRSIREPDPALLETLDTVAGQVAQLVERRRAEEAVRATADRLGLALAAARLGDWSWDAATDVVTLSDRAAAVFGIPPGPHMTWTAMQALLHPDDRDRAGRAVERAVAEGSQYDIEYRVTRPDGAPVWVSALGRAQYGPDGRPDGMYGVVQDVTRRKATEEALRDEKRAVETLSGIGARLSAELDLNKLLQAVTDETVAMTGAGFGAFFYNSTDPNGDAYLLYTLSGAPREAFEKFPHPRATAIFEPTFKGQGTVRLDDVTADPRYGQNPPHTGMPAGHLPVRSYLAVPVKSRSGGVLGGLFFGHPQAGVFTPRHERLVEGVAAQAAVAIDNARLYEAARRERERAEASERVSRFLADASASLATLVDYESTLQKVARLAVPRFADWAAVDVAQDDGSLRRLAVAHADPAKVELAHDLDRRYPPDPAAPHGAYHVLTTGRPEMMADIPDGVLASAARDAEHLRIIRALGLRSYVCVPLAVRGKTFGALTFVSAESGRRYGEADLAVATDLANRAAVAIESAQLYRDVREEARRKDEFLAMLAHELRNPLAPVRNGLQILKTRGIDAASAERTRDMMDRQVTHLVRMVDDLMDVSRVMRGKVDLRKEPVDLAAVVARAVETAQPAIDAAEHRLEVSAPDRPVRVHGDVVRLTQVLSNLLVNAAKYSDRSGYIWVTVRRAGGQAEVRVKDTGVGLTKDDLARVFDLFAQVDRSAARSQGGLGIGLTLVKRLTELHGGTVTARSDGPGRGSEFVVRLPALAEEPSGSGGGDGPAGLRPAARRVLIVDDNVDSAESLALLLRLSGHEVRTAYDPPGGLEAAGAFRPDVILLDIGLPGMDGYEVARRLRQAAWSAETLVVAMTGYGSEDDRRRSREAGFDHHLVKPVDPADLEKVLAGAASRL